MAKRDYIAMAKTLQADNKRFTDQLQQIPPPDDMPANIIEVWRSSRFLVQIYAPEKGAQRISICRTMVDIGNGKWIDGIKWEEIQDIKSQLGFGDRDAVEIYPHDKDVVNVANMRHIWLLETQLPFAWRKK